MTEPPGRPRSMVTGGATQIRRAASRTSALRSTSMPAQSATRTSVAMADDPLSARCTVERSTPVRVAMSSSVHPLRACCARSSPAMYSVAGSRRQYLSRRSDAIPGVYRPAVASYFAPATSRALISLTLYVCDDGPFFAPGHLMPVTLTVYTDAAVPFGATTGFLRSNTIEFEP